MATPSSCSSSSTPSCIRVVPVISHEAEGLRSCSVLTVTQVWAGGGAEHGGEKQVGQCPLTLLADTCLVWALKVLNPRKPLTPEPSRCLVTLLYQHPQTCPSWGQCAWDVSWATQPSHRAVSRQSEDPRAGHKFRVLCPSAFLGCSMRQNLALSSDVAKACPRDGSDGEIAERGSSGGLGQPWGSKGSGRWDPKEDSISALRS